MATKGHTILIVNLHSKLLIFDKAFREALSVHMQDLEKSCQNNLLKPNNSTAQGIGAKQLHIRASSLS